MFKEYLDNIDFTEASSKRAIVWLLVALIGIPAWWVGKDITGLLLLAGAIVGGLGLLPDKKAV